MCKNVHHVTSAPLNSKTEVTLKQSDIDGNTSCTICAYSIICFSQVQPLCLVYWNHCYYEVSLWCLQGNITESFTKVQEISEGNCDVLSFPKKQTNWSNQKLICSTYCWHRIWIVMSSIFQKTKIKRSNQKITVHYHVK
jgi:hypothetical protein